MRLRTLWRKAAEAVYPKRCLFCGTILPMGAYLCESCDGSVRPVPVVRTLPLSDGTVFSCLGIYPFVDVRKGIHCLKFLGQKEIGTAYGELLAEEDAVLELIRDADLLVPVPISRRRRNERGFNQSMVIAEALCSRTGIPTAEAAHKLRNNAVQSSLEKEARQENVRGVYEGDPAIAAGKRIVLLDDIVTTGATIGACAEALYAAGALSVQGLAFAHTAED